MADSRQLPDLLHDRGFVSRVASQVSLPYRRTSERQIVRHNGDLTVTFSALGDEMPYGKWPRLFDAYLATMVTSKDPSYDPSRRRLYLGGTWRSFMKRLGANVGGSQLKVIKRQMENWFKTSYMVERAKDTESHGVAFQVGEGWNIDWLKNEPQDDVLPGFDNWVEFGERFIEKVVCDNPVPVSLDSLAMLGKSPMALDVYLWVNRRMAYLKEPQLVSWKMLYQQFGSDSRMAKFKENFKKAVARVRESYPAVNITVNDERGVTLFPSATSVPTVAQARASELLSKQTRKRDEKRATVGVREVSEADIIRVVDRIDYGEDYVAVRRHVVHGLNAGLSAEKIIREWNAGERL
jgi:hypothetical protein